MKNILAGENIRVKKEEVDYSKLPVVTNLFTDVYSTKDNFINSELKSLGESFYMRADRDDKLQRLADLMTERQMRGKKNKVKFQSDTVNTEWFGQTSNYLPSQGDFLETYKEMRTESDLPIF